MTALYSCWWYLNSPFPLSTAWMHLNVLLSHPILPPCSLQAGDTVCGHHCLVGPPGFPSAGLSAFLPDQSEEEGQEGCCPGEDCPKRWQRGWGRGLPTGWRDTRQRGDNGDVYHRISTDYFSCVYLRRWSRTSPNSVNIPRQKTQRNPRALRSTLK